MRLTMTKNVDIANGYTEWVSETGQKYMLRFDFTRYLENYLDRRLWGIDHINDNVTITIDDNSFKSIAKTKLVKEVKINEN